MSLRNNILQSATATLGAPAETEGTSYVDVMTGKEYDTLEEYLANRVDGSLTVTPSSMPSLLKGILLGGSASTSAPQAGSAGGFSNGFSGGFSGGGE